MCVCVCVCVCVCLFLVVVWLSLRDCSYNPDLEERYVPSASAPQKSGSANVESTWLDHVLSPETPNVARTTSPQPSWNLRPGLAGETKSNWY